MRSSLLASAAVLALAIAFDGRVSSAQQAGTAQAKPLDYEFFKARVQPIFLNKRPGHARCVSCHQGRTGLSLATLSPGATTWNEDQTRHNYEVASQFVVPGQPSSSRLLMHPLSPEAGGDPFHGGGRQFDSKSNPEWQALATWAGATATDVSTAAQVLDFDFYRARVEPIFLNPRQGGGGGGGTVACFACHSVFATPMRLEPLSAGATTWTVEQSRRNFEAVAGLITPGEPLKSRLLLQPLATQAGGTQRHTGGKFWTSQSDPEFLTMSEWVNRRK
jgi:hypothetical protein